MQDPSTIDIPTYLILVLPPVSMCAGQLQLLYRLSRVGGGPGTFRKVFRERYKQHRSILVMDAIAGLAALGVVAVVGPAGPLSTLFSRNPVVGWLLVGAIAPFGLAGFVRGAIVQGLLKPEWLAKDSDSPGTAAILGVQILREEAVDLMIRTLWKTVRNQNETAYEELKHEIEARIASGEIATVRLVRDVHDFFRKRRTDPPPEVTDAIAALEKPSVSERTNRNRLEKLAASLLNSENWEPLERLRDMAKRGDEGRDGPDRD